MKINFEDNVFLKKHINSILNFYNRNAFDSQGGFFHRFLDDGKILDKDSRHLVSSTRFVFNYVNAFLMTKNYKYLNWAQHGIDYLISAHKNKDTNHYYWQISKEKIIDSRAMTYGHAFVMLAGASAMRVGLKDGNNLLRDMWNFLNQYFWEEDFNAYADERDASLKLLNSYRGQNANMHSVEALLASFEATKNERFLERCEIIANQFVINLAEKSGGQIWEHYTSDWKIDWEYNKLKPDDTFKPWGFQPGHQVEWAKLLLQIDEYMPKSWHKEKAIYLFDRAIKMGMDKKYGGIFYGYSPEGKVTNENKYFWVQAEAIAAAWRLYKVTNDEKYYNYYNLLWKWCWDHFIDHKFGGWYCILNRKGEKITNEKSPLGKTDYHTMGACWDIIKINNNS